MAAKRPRSTQNEDNQSQQDRPPRKGPKRRSRREDIGGPQTSTAVNPIKNRIRDLKRTLDRSENLSADVRVEKERALAGYKLDLEKAEYEKRKQQMIKKYHMVRFFERQKATRRLKRLKSRLLKTDRESEECVDLRDKIHRAEVDLNYTLYCPLAEKYTSLYKYQDGGVISDITMSNDSHISQGSEASITRPPMWTTVETCMTAGTLKALRDGKISRAVAHVANDEPASAQRENRSQGSKKSKSRKANMRKASEINSLEAGDNASDGGFFEE